MKDRMFRSLVQTLLAVTMLVQTSPAIGADRQRASSGETQVVARVDNREITISELRLEMARLGLSPTSADAERAALESLVRRTILANEARNQKLQRTPEAMVRMFAAQDQALADFLLASASQPAEPTPAEIEAFIDANASLFKERKTYDFVTIEMPTRFFNASELTPLFDKEADFARLKKILDAAGAPYSETISTQSAAVFPRAIRDTLNSYDVKDNIVLKGDTVTKIMKMTSVRREDIGQGDWRRIARSVLLEQSAVERANAFLTRLSDNANVAYFRDSAKPAEAIAKREQ